MPRIVLALLLIIVTLGDAKIAAALPPLGLTQIDSAIPDEGFLIDLSVIGDTAYVSTSDGLWQVDASGSAAKTTIVHSELGSAVRLTPVTRIDNGDLYVAGNFEVLSSSSWAGALFRVDDPLAEIVTWPQANNVVGIDRNLRTIAGVGNSDNGASVAQFFADGSVVLLDAPQGSTTADNQYPAEVSSSGFTTGIVTVPGTLGFASVLWAPDGSVSYLSGSEGAGAISDRSDTNGLNISLSEGGGTYPVQLGNMGLSLARTQDGDFLPSSGRSLVSSSDFVLVQEFSALTVNFPRINTPHFGYYPGILSSDPQAVVELDIIFPELADLDYYGVSDLFSVENRVYLTLYGPNGLHLFGALDPSRSIPEPSSALVCLLGLLVLSYCRHGKLTKEVRL